jgi:hypothetical protein
MLLDELVSRIFHGPPPCRLKYVTVLHADGDPWNCAATNLAWHIYPVREHDSMVSLMRPDNVTRRKLHLPPRITFILFGERN